MPLFSVRQHMKYKECYFHAESNVAILSFPTETIQLSTTPEILFDATPSTHNDILAFDYECATLVKD